MHLTLIDQPIMTVEQRSDANGDDMLKATAYLKTAHGSRYLQQLCKHFAHKAEVEFTPTEGLCALRSGPARMWADEAGLRVEVTASDEGGLAGAKRAIDSHLQRIASREGFDEMPWV